MVGLKKSITDNADLWCMKMFLQNFCCSNKDHSTGLVCAVSAVQPFFFVCLFVCFYDGALGIFIDRQAQYKFYFEDVEVLFSLLYQHRYLLRDISKLIWTLIGKHKYSM